MATIEELSQLDKGATHVDKQPFIITTSIFLAIALFATIIHFSLLKLRHSTGLLPFSLALVASALCLISSTTAIHLGLTDIYLANALSFNPPLIPSPPPAEFVTLAASALQHGTAFTCLIWTSIFAAKLSLLCFFKNRIDTQTLMSRRVKPYWLAILIVATAVWVFMIASPFIACPHHGGEGALHCSPPSALPYAVATLDIFNTILVLSLPYLLLYLPTIHSTSLLEPSPTFTSQPHQKASLAALTTLCFAQILLALIRCAIYSHDAPFQYCLLFLEACIGITSAVLTTATQKNVLTTAQRLQTPSQRAADQHQRTRLHLHSHWIPGTLTPRPRTSSRKSLRPQSLRSYDPIPLSGLTTFIEGGMVRTPSRLTKSCGLRRQESVLRTREVFVEVHYETDVEKGEWDRVTSPSWMDEKWKRPSSGSSASQT